MQKTLKLVEKDKTVKAVVLKLNTPGGTVTGSDAMYREVMRFKERTGRPVVLTRHGRGVAVILSSRAFEELEAAARRADLQVAIDQAEKSYALGPGGPDIVVVGVGEGEGADVIAAQASVRDHRAQHDGVEHPHIDQAVAHGERGRVVCFPVLDLAK